MRYLFSFGVHMRQRWVIPILFIFTFVMLLAITWQTPVEANGSQSSAGLQLPTGSIPTVTSSPSGPMAMMKTGGEPQANLRSGPGIFYDQVGILLAGQRVPATGRSPGGDWVQVEYLGAPGGVAWVYANLVDIQPLVLLPVVEPPPRPTPVITSTIDPTLAARFVVTVEPSRLPTFTEPPPLVIPTYILSTGPSVGGIPMGFVILGLAVLGVFLGIIAFAQAR
jgi:hypothetical protein